MIRSVKQAGDYSTEYYNVKLPEDIEKDSNKVTFHVVIFGDYIKSRQFFIQLQRFSPKARYQQYGHQ